jgi:hypothetical protein
LKYLNIFKCFFDSSMVHIGISNNEQGIWYRWFIFPIIQQSSYPLLSNNHHIPTMVSNNIDHQLIGNTLFPDKPMSTHGGIDVRSYCMQKTGDVSNQNKTWCETAEPRWMRRDTSIHDKQKKWNKWYDQPCIFSAANFPTENPQVKMPARVARQKMWRAFLAGGMLEGQ